ncbi:MAG: prepilin peptidase [Clostridia bacterium]
MMTLLVAFIAGGLALLVLSRPAVLGVDKVVPPRIRAVGAGLALLTGGVLFLHGGLLACVAGWAALMGAAADVVDRVIPHRWVGLLGLVGLVRMAAGAAPWLPGLILAAVVGAFFLVLYILLHGGIGLGDVKLAAAMGLGLGWPLGLDALIYGLLAGGVWGAALLVSRRAGARDTIAFGPFLALGVLVALVVHPL